ncbi:MAG: formate dehydrogenase accessory sulfurtransferase FdhD [Candidatus Methanospirareceae archaeon]
MKGNRRCPLLRKGVKCIRLRDDGIVESEHDVAEETALSIFVNGRHFLTAMISPGMEKEFVIGHLFSEGIIKNVKEIESLQIEGSVAKVIITNPQRVLIAREVIVSGCGGAFSFESRLPKVNSNLKVHSKHIFSGIKAISSSNLHKITGGVHSVGLFHENNAICISEDIGRHNALDKVIGYGLTKGVDFKGSFVTCTGRISSEMAMKCAVANIPVIASRGATTSLAVEIGKKSGLTIVGFVRGNEMNVYTNPDRIVFGDFG